MDLGAEEDWHNWPDADDPDLIDNEDGEDRLYSGGILIQDKQLGEKNYLEHHPVDHCVPVSNVYNQEQEQSFAVAQPQHHVSPLLHASQTSSSQLATSQSADTEPTYWESLFDFTSPKPKHSQSSPPAPPESSPDPFISRFVPPAPSPQDSAFAASSHSEPSTNHPTPHPQDSAYASVEPSSCRERSTKSPTTEAKADTPNLGPSRQPRVLGPDYVPARVKGIKPTRDGDWVNYFLENPEQLRREAPPKLFDWNNLQLEVSSVNQLPYYPGTSASTRASSRFSESVASVPASTETAAVAQSSFVPALDPLVAAKFTQAAKGYISPYTRLGNALNFGETVVAAQTSTETALEEPASLSPTFDPLLVERFASVKGDLNLYTQEAAPESRAPSTSREQHTFKTPLKRTAVPEQLPSTDKRRLVGRTPSPETHTFKTPLKRPSATPLPPTTKKRRLVNHTPVSSSSLTRVEPPTEASRLKRSSVGWTRLGSRASPVPSSPLDSRRSSLPSQRSRRGSLLSLPAGHIPDHPPNLEAPSHVLVKYRPDLGLEDHPPKHSLTVKLPVCGDKLEALEETGRLEPFSGPNFTYPPTFRKKELCEIVWPGSITGQLTAKMAPGVSFHDSIPYLRPAKFAIVSKPK